MCDVCIKRNRAYQALPDEDREAVDDMAAQWMPQLALLRDTDQAAWETGYLAFGESLDIMLGLTPAFTDDDMAQLGEPSDDHRVMLVLPPRHSSIPQEATKPETHAHWWRRLGR